MVPAAGIRHHMVAAPHIHRPDIVGVRDNRFAPTCRHWRVVLLAEDSHHMRFVHTLAAMCSLAVDLVVHTRLVVDQLVGAVHNLAGLMAELAHKRVGLAVDNPVEPVHRLVGLEAEPVVHKLVALLVDNRRAVGLLVDTVGTCTVASVLAQVRCRTLAVPDPPEPQLVSLQSLPLKDRWL